MKTKEKVIITNDGIDVHDQARMDVERVSAATEEFDQARDAKGKVERRLKGISGVVSNLRGLTPDLRHDLFLRSREMQQVGGELGRAKSGARVRYKDNEAAYKKAAILDARINGVEVKYPDQDEDSYVVAGGTNEDRLKELNRAEESHYATMAVMGRGGDELARSGGGFAYTNSQALENIANERARIEQDA